MSKDRNFTGQPIFTQILKFVSRPKIKRIALKYNADRYTKKLNTYNHFVTRCAF